MERNIDMKEVSDGRLYTSNDLVKADCGGCEGCSACCQGMGESIVLDPLDIHRLCCGLHTDFNGLMVDKIELQIVDSVILPNLKMASGNTEACSFLNPEGRCSIHAFRPGICRLFPLGRFYENGSFKYFLQIEIHIQVCKFCFLYFPTKGKCCRQLLLLLPELLLLLFQCLLQIFSSI